MARIQLAIAALILAVIFAIGGTAAAGKEKFVRSKPHVNADSDGPAQDAADTAKKVGVPTAVEGGADAEAPAEAERRVPERLRHKSREASDAAAQGVTVRGWDPIKKEESQ